MKSGIYRIVNTVNGKVYIGSTIDFTRRWAEHRHWLNKGTHTGVYLQRAWSKYGESAFVFETVEEVEPERLLEREQFYLDLLFEEGNHYNVLPAAGSSRGVVRSSETRVRMSEAAKVRTASLKALEMSRGKNKGTKLSEETRAKMSASRKGKKQTAEWIRKRAEASIGKKMSDEAKAAMSRTRKGRKPSAESNAKRSATLKGRTLTEEHKAKIATGNKGKVRSEATRAKISTTKKAQNTRRE